MDKVELLSKSKNRLSKIVIATTAIIALYIVFTDKFWKIDNVIRYDMNGYYEYLPALFIYHDIDLKYVDTVIMKPGEIYTYEISPTNKRFIKYSSGVSYLVAPFFLAAEFLCPIFKQPVTGYSDPFEIATILSGIFYFIVGLIFLRKALLHFYNDTVTALTLFAVALCTNLFFYSTTQSLMSHVYSFCTSAVFLYFLIQWFKKANFLNSIFVGLSLGLLVLLRPVNIILVLVFLFYDITSFSQIKSRFKLFYGSKIYLITITLFAILIWLPQLFYWHYIAGQWFFFSYQKETFYLSHPYLLKGLFGFRNGWLIYTPVMLLIFPGIFFLLKTAKQFFLPLMIFTPLFITIVLSWWCWWYPGFGNRAFIDAYALFSLPIAALLNRIFSLQAIPKMVAVAFIFFLCYLNLFQSWQMKYGILHYDSMTAEAYRVILFKKVQPNGFQYLLKSPDYQGAKMNGKETAH